MPYLVLSNPTTFVNSDPRNKNKSESDRIRNTGCLAISKTNDDAV